MYKQVVKTIVSVLNAIDDHPSNFKHDAFFIFLKQNWCNNKIIVGVLCLIGVP